MLFGPTGYFHKAQLTNVLSLRFSMSICMTLVGVLWKGAGDDKPETLFTRGFVEEDVSNRRCVAVASTPASSATGHSFTWSIASGLWGIKYRLSVKVIYWPIFRIVADAGCQFFKIIIDLRQLFMSSVHTKCVRLRTVNQVSRIYRLPRFFYKWREEKSLLEVQIQDIVRCAKEACLCQHNLSFVKKRPQTGTGHYPTKGTLLVIRSNCQWFESKVQCTVKYKVQSEAESVTMGEVDILAKKFLNNRG